MSSVHAVRAKKWGTNTFVAEWFANAVAYCQTKEGKKEFEAWLVEKYGRVAAKQKLLDCQRPPRKKYGVSAFGNRKMFNSAAFDLGISDEAMEEYHLFTANSNLCVPPRIKPAPKRRRGESSAEWLADKSRDTYEVWHTDVKIFVEDIIKRSPTTLINPEIIGRPEEIIHRLDYAFRASLHAVTLSYMTWGHAVDVFEELDRRGLVSTSAIERAYKQDSALMWRLVACLCKISYLDGHLWERFTEIMSWCEYYRPYFKRYRALHGSSRVEINRAYLKQRGGYATALDNLIIETIDTDASGNPAFFDAVLKCLDEDPSEATKFSSEAYQEMGDLAIVKEFKAQIFDSAFGQRLSEYATSKDQQCRSDPNFWPISTFMDQSKIQWVPRNSNDWTYARTVSRSLGSTWLATTNRMSMANFFVYCIKPPTNPLDFPRLFDDSWRVVDMALWELAKALDRTNGRGTVAKKFGLFDPTGPERPSSIETMLKQIRLGETTERTPAAPTPRPRIDNIQSVPSGPSPVVSGHSYMADTVNIRAKDKVKTRGAASATATAADEAGEEDEEEEEILPDALPNDFKIGKKLLKVFHCILEAPGSPDEKEMAGAKKGQIRWAEFERAMKRIGFGICQTAGSSVRFDPPAKTARPITFHRPHPDSILTPNLLRWIGARLKRCYGWTTATFERASTDGED